MRACVRAGVRAGGRVCVDSAIRIEQFHYTKTRDNSSGLPFSRVCVRACGRVCVDSAIRIEQFDYTETVTIL